MLKLNKGQNKWEYFREVGKVWKDMWAMEKWVRKIVEWVEDKKLEELEEESESELGDRDRGEGGRRSGSGGIRGEECGG